MSRYTVARKARLAEMQRRLERRRAIPGNEEAAADWLPPDPSAIEIMQRVDRMPKPWRELIHDYGLLTVEGHWLEQYNLDDAWFSLAAQRDNRQLEYAKPFPAGRIRTLGRRGLNVDPGEAFDALVTNL